MTEWSPFADYPVSHAGSFFSSPRVSRSDSVSVASSRLSNAESRSSSKRRAGDTSYNPTPKRQSTSRPVRSVESSRMSNSSSGLFCTPFPSPSLEQSTPIAGPSRPPPSIPNFSDLRRSSTVSSLSITPQLSLHAPSSALIRPDSRQSSQSLGTRSRLILAFDFGTGYSSASYFLVEPGHEEATSILGKIKTISDYPGYAHNRNAPMSRHVPSELIYSLGGPPVRRTRQSYARLAEENDLSAGATYADDPFGDRDEWDVSQTSFVSLDGPPNRNERYRWGYDALQAWIEATTLEFRKFKLLLQDTPETEGVREKLNRDLKTLAARGTVKKPTDLIIDFLTPFIAHVKKILEEEGVYAKTDKEIVMCIPTIWSQRACRTMHVALAKAFTSVGVEGVHVGNKSIKNLFIVSEPEAAAEVVLWGELDIRPNQRLVFVDAGAGTVDLITYLVDNNMPLRLKEEGAPPSGGMCGSGFLNEEFQAYMVSRLKKHRMLHDKDDAWHQRKASEITWNHFEFHLKRYLNIYEENPLRNHNMRTDGLPDDRANGFATDHVRIPYDDIKRIFLGCFHKIWDLVQGQLEACKNRGRQANTLDPGSHEATVSIGAVLRAFNKELGPQRFARSSLGFLRHLPHDVYLSKHQPYDHADAYERPRPAPITKEPYVRNTIEWFIKKDQIVPKDFTMNPIRMVHFIARCEDPKLVVWEAIYISDSAKDSHYKITHARNKGK
ncbi:Hsp70 family protein [Apiospora arundinis]|uniref:Hsp70 family protein n=1 Tax=Apiospora arundinis TaxID=335852 RepID=A0ABR2JI25_9PEZI